MGGGGGGRLLTFSAFKMDAYSWWALIRGWALIRINTVKKNYKPKAKDKAKKTTLFFSKPGRVCNKVKTKYRRAVRPSRNFYRCTGCFQSKINITCRNTQNAARKYHSLLKITHNKTINSFINKGK